MSVAALKLNIANGVLSLSRTKMEARLHWSGFFMQVYNSQFQPAELFPPRRPLICPEKFDSCLLGAILWPDPLNSWEVARNWGVKGGLIHGKGQLEVMGGEKEKIAYFSIEEQFLIIFGYTLAHFCHKNIPWRSYLVQSQTLFRFPGILEGQGCLLKKADWLVEHVGSVMHFHTPTCLNQRVCNFISFYFLRI